MEPQCTRQETRHHPQRDHEDCHRLPETHPNGVPPGIIWHCTSCPTQGKPHTQTCEQGLAGPEPSPTQTCIGLSKPWSPTPAFLPPVLPPLSIPWWLRFQHASSMENQLAADSPTPPPPTFSHPKYVQAYHRALIFLARIGTLNRLRTGVGRFNANMHRWGLRPSAACPCGAEEQTAHHIIHECPTFPPPNDLDLENPNPDTVSWLQRLSDTA